MWKNNILETIGNTPLVKLNNIVKDLPCTVLAKIETTVDLIHQYLYTKIQKNE